MSKRCEYCDSPIPEGAAECPECGAPVNGSREDGRMRAKPETIAELKEWYAARNLPPYETTRFFIGVDYKKPRAFGIYEEDGIFTVYKNKNDGTRAIRYQGPDEAHAVGELYERLKQEIQNQKAENEARRSGETGSRAGKNGKPLLAIFTAIGAFLVASISARHILLAIVLVAVPYVLYRLLDNNENFRERHPGWEKTSDKVHKAFLPYLIVVIAAMLVLGIRFKTPAYYDYDDDVYCSYGGGWYLYDNYNYYPVDTVPAGLTENRQDYRITEESEQWSSRYDFENSIYYEEHFDSSADSDSDWDSSDSWDSGSTDFDSDW